MDASLAQLATGGHGCFGPGTVNSRLCRKFALQLQVTCHPGGAVSVEQLWQRYCEDCTQWSDCRNNKHHSKAPDFLHKTTNETLWIDSWNTPHWVREALGKLTASRRNVKGSCKSGTGSQGVCTAENYANTKLCERDQYSWTLLISEFVKCGQGRQALSMYKEMRQRGMKPSSYTLVAVLKACSCLQNLESAKQVHADVVESGFELDAYVGTMLIDAYVKCGNLVDARQVFDKMPQRDVVSWTAIIHGYTQMQEGEAALKMYALMQQEGVAPNNRTFVCALKACSALAALREGDEASRTNVRQRCLEQVRDIHSQIVESGSESAVFIGTVLVDVYAKCGSLVDARSVFDRMPHRNVVSWTVMITGYAQMEEGEEALELYAQMQQQGVVPNERTFVGALKGCSVMASVEEGNYADVKERSLEQVRAIHSQVVKSGYESVVFVGTMLVDAYAKCGCLVDARRVFDKMSRRDAVSWNAMILGYAHMEDGEVALELYTKMQHEGIAPSDRTFIGVLKACAVVARLEMGRKVHAEISRSQRMVNDLYVAASLIDMYFKCGSMENALQVFDALPTRDVVTWNALIGGYTHHGESELVFQSFHRMRQEGIQPNGPTFLSLLTVCSRVGLVNKGERYFEAMHMQFGITPTIRHYTCVIDLLGHAGQLDKVMAMVKSLPFQTDSAVWQTVLCACRKWGHVELGRHAFDSAMKLNIHDAAAYVLMSNIYTAAEMWDEAKEIQRDIQAMTLQTRPWKQPGRSWLTDTGGTVHAFLVEDREHPLSLHIHILLRDIRVIMDEAYELHHGSLLQGHTR